LLSSLFKFFLSPLQLTQTNNSHNQFFYQIFNSAILPSITLSHARVQMATAPAELEVLPQTERQDSQHSMVATNGDHKEASQENTEFDPAPEGGTRAWLVAGGGAAIFFCTLGFANSFGAFEEYYLTHQLLGYSPSRVAWIGSLQSFLQFFAGMFGGPLFDRYGGKV
jgi:hypothetical protein